MQTKAKENSVVTTSYDAEAQAISYTVIGHPTLTLKLSMVSEANKARAIVHGFGQRVVDAAAIPAEPLPATPEGREAQKVARAARKHDLIQKVIEHYNSGSEDWSAARAAGVVGLDRILLGAVCEVLGKDEATVRGLVKLGAEKREVTQGAYLAKLATNADVAKVVDRMRAETAGEMSADEELAGMMG